MTPSFPNSWTRPIRWSCVSACLLAMPVQAATVKQVNAIPISSVVLANLSGGGTAISDRTSPNQFEASGQVVEESALDGNEVNINRLYLRVSDGTQIPTTGTHEIEFWIGEWDLANDAAGTELLRESFDVVGLNFVDGEVYEFEFSTPFSLDETKDYTFQVWWTTDDASHDIAWDRDTGQGNVDGGFISSKTPSLSLPFDAKPSNNTDLFFAFATIPEPSSAMLTMIGGLAGLMHRRRSV